MFQQAVNRVLAVLRDIPDFRGSVYMTLADPNVPPPMLVYDVTDVTILEDAANAGEFISALSVTLQVWSTDEQEALRLVDVIQQALVDANLVEARDNIFTISDEFTPAQPGVPTGILRVICQYRLRMF